MRLERRLLMNGALFLGPALLAGWLTQYIHQPKVPQGPAESPVFNRREGRSWSQPALRVEGPVPRLTLGTATDHPPIEIPETLSPFQQASLTAPAKAGRLNSELVMALHAPYEAALQCYAGSDLSVLTYNFHVRSNGVTANVLGATLGEVKQGAPVNAEVISCIGKALNRPFELRTKSDDPFPEDLEADIPVEIAMGGGAGGT
jgi:hypothetical protein